MDFTPTTFQDHSGPGVDATWLNAVEAALADAVAHHKFGTAAARPAAAAANKGWLYFATDTHEVSISDGNAWTIVLTASTSVAVVPAVRAYSTTDNFVATPAGTPTAVPFNKNLYDTAGIHSETANTTRFIAPAAGIYAINALTWFGAGGTNEVQVKLNGLTVEHDVSLSGQLIPVATTMLLAANDYVELVAVAAAASSLRGGSVAGQGVSGRTHFEMTRLGAAA